MSTEETTALPYIFDLLYDFKTVEDLHAHITGVQRFSTSATDRELVQLMGENDIPLPKGYFPPPITPLPDSARPGHYEELLDVMRQLHEHAKRYDSDDRAPMDRTLVLEQTGKVLAKQGSLTDAQRQAYENPSPYLAK